MTCIERLKCFMSFLRMFIYLRIFIFFILGLLGLNASVCAHDGNSALASASAGNGVGGLRLNIFGEGEASGFMDVSTNSTFANGRTLTSTLPDGSASNIFIRNAPISGQDTIPEIMRLSQPGTTISIMQPTEGFQGQALLDAFGGRATVDFSNSFTSGTVAPGVKYNFMRLKVGQ